MATIRLHYVDELIAARQQQHGGNRGAPRLVNNVRIGASINRSVIVMLSAMLQSYVEDVFEVCAKQRFPAFAANPLVFDDYWKQMKNWGNPSAGNIKILFLKLGVADVLDGLRWQKTNAAKIKERLDDLNQLRNRIAHGQALQINGHEYSLSLVKAQSFRNFAEVFGQRFEPHAIGRL